MRIAVFRGRAYDCNVVASFNGGDRGTDCFYAPCEGGAQNGGIRNWVGTESVWMGLMLSVWVKGRDALLDLGINGTEGNASDFYENLVRTRLGRLGVGVQVDIGLRGRDPDSFIRHWWVVSRAMVVKKIKNVGGYERGRK